jgi:iron complex outermembrane receptor protein
VETSDAGATTFLNHYRDLQTTEPEVPFFTTSPAPPHLVSPLVFRNKGSVNTRGVEIFANWNPTQRWKLNAGWSAIHLRVIQDPASQDTLVQFQLRSSVNLTRRLDWASAVYYVGRLRDAGDGDVPAYTRVDTRLAWQPGESIEISIDGQNLLRSSHAEFHNAFEVRRTLVQRSVFATITWRF